MSNHYGNLVMQFLKSITPCKVFLFYIFRLVAGGGGGGVSRYKPHGFFRAPLSCVIFFLCCNSSVAK